MFSFLGTPLGWIMKLIFSVIPNYGLVLIIFTILVRLVLFPLNVKQQKNSAKMALFNPKMQKLQKQYGKDKQRYQEEMMKLYEEEGYNPMSSCLPMILQMIVLFGIIDVVYKPLKHLLSVPSDLIEQAQKVLTDLQIKSSSPELSIISIIQGNHSNISADVFDKIFSSDIIAQIQNFDMNFLGINMGTVPSFTWPLLLIPILSGVTSLLVSIFSMRQQKKNGMMDQAQTGMGMMKGMMYIMPIFSTWIAFSLPTGVGFYWIVSNILSFVQTIILYTIYSPEKMKAKVEAEMEEKKRQQKDKKKSRYRQAVEAAMEQQRNGQTPAKAAVPASSDDLTPNQRIALARKRMAEKYGDEYDEK